PKDSQAGIMSILTEESINFTNTNKDIQFESDIVKLLKEKSLVYICFYIVVLFFCLFLYLFQEHELNKELISIKILVGANKIKVCLEQMMPLFLLSIMCYLFLWMYFQNLGIYFYMIEQNLFSWSNYLIVAMLGSILLLSVGIIYY